MTETKMHRFLKDVGMAFLFNQNCFLVATEIHIIYGRERIDTKLDNKQIIDVCGVGEKYIPEHLRKYKYVPWEHNGKTTECKMSDGPNKFNITRGIEVKVSRTDFKNGFCCSGCNFNYIMVPEGLVYCNEVPKEVGVIKVDVNNFKSQFGALSGFSLQGVRVVRKPKFKQVKQYVIDFAISDIAKRATRQLMVQVAEKLAAASNLSERACS